MAVGNIESMAMPLTLQPIVRYAGPVTDAA